MFPREQEINRESKSVGEKRLLREIISRLFYIQSVSKKKLREEDIVTQGLLKLH